MTLEYETLSASNNFLDTERNSRRVVTRNTHSMHESVEIIRNDNMDNTIISFGGYFEMYRKNAITVIDCGVELNIFALERSINFLNLVPVVGGVAAMVVDKVFAQYKDGIRSGMQTGAYYVLDNIASKKDMQEEELEASPKDDNNEVIEYIIPKNISSEYESSEYESFNNTNHSIEYVEHPASQHEVMI